MQELTLITEAFKSASFISNSGPFFAFLGAALAAGLGAVGSSFGVGIAGQAATGLAAEKPELSGKAIILEALPSSQAVYGFVGAFLVIGKFSMEMTSATGLALFAASLPLALGALFSGIYQGKVLAGGMNMLAKGEENFGKAIILAVMVETFALFGFLVTFLMIDKIPA
jgi:V/A-type H+-transporting ATPase subunit K